MKQVALINNHSNDLILIFGGWGVDEHLFSMLTCASSDLSLVYDYRDGSCFDPTLYRQYCTIRVIAWSMGVFEAAKALYGTHLPITESIAVNGTLNPIDDQLGIAEHLYNGTLEAMNATNLLKFRVRMCGSRSNYYAMEPYLPHRDIEDLREELIAIQQHYLHDNGSLMTFQKALVSLQDLIFSAGNQRRAWQKEAVIIDTMEGAHWPDFQMIIDEYGQR